MSAEMKCAECGHLESTPQHARENWNSSQPKLGAHPFEPEPEPTPAERPKKTERVAKLQPSAATSQGPTLCSICQKPRTNHRGRSTHPFTHPDVTLRPSRAVKRATKPRSSRRNAQGGASPKKRKPARRVTAAEQPDILTLARDINELRAQLDGKIAALKELLA